jgi:DNA primase
MTILDLLREDGIEPKRTSSTNGGQYASECPLCGGKDRFCSWPEEGNGGRWWCRGCERSGDLIQYLRDVRGLPFQDACRMVGREPQAGPHRPISCRAEKSQRGWEPKAIPNPPPEWSQKAEALVSWAEERLWEKDGEETVHWLIEGRGLSEDTVKGSRLGWVPQSYNREREAWGLSAETKEDGKPKLLWIPRGLLIPYVLGGNVVKVKIRRPDPDSDPRYYMLPGSCSKPMVFGEGRAVVIVVESELDGFLVHQEAGDLVSTIALGSALIRPDKRAADLLNKADGILVSLDLDPAGARQTWTWWMENFDRAIRWSPLPGYGKDPTEMWRAGINIREWIEAGIAEVLENFDPKPV